VCTLCMCIYIYIVPETALKDLPHMSFFSNLTLSSNPGEGTDAYVPLSMKRMLV
jgi:hypothetical protein